MSLPLLNGTCVALAIANYTISNWDAAPCAYEPKKNTISGFLLFIVIAMAITAFTVFCVKVSTVIIRSQGGLLEELWLTPAEELHEEVKRRFTRRASGERKQALENKYRLRYKFVTFEMDETSQTKIVTLREDMRKIPRSDRIWKRENVSKAREVLHHTHPAPLRGLRAAFDPAPAAGAPIGIPIQASSPAPAIGTTLSTPGQLSLPAPAIDSAFGQLSFPRNQNEDTSRRSRETININADEAPAVPTPMATNSENVPQYGELAPPPPAYNSHGFANPP